MFAATELCEKLNYQFKDPELLRVALTHRSVAADNNERLEFLGDSVLNFIIGEALYQKFPDEQEGALTRWRSTLVKRDALTELACQFDLGKHLHLGHGELKSGGHLRESILSCAMEAVIGAIYLDAGFEKCRQCVLAWYEPLLESLSDVASHKDPKSKLQEYLQLHKVALPRYEIISTEGEAHSQSFVVDCIVEGLNTKATGRGSSRRKAEQEAASKLLEKIKHD